MYEWTVRMVAWLFDESAFSARRFCAGMSSELIWVWVISDFTILLSYTILSLNFAWLIRRRHDRSIWSIFYFLGVFVFLCGLTHGFGVLVMWVPMYHFGAVVNVLTAAVSAVAAILTAVLTPRIMRVPNVKALYDMNMTVRKTVHDLLDEITIISKEDPAQAKQMLETLARRMKSK